MDTTLDWTQFTFSAPANRHYKILLLKTHTEIVRIENALQLPALWQATIAKLTKETSPPELAPAAKPFYELHSTGHVYGNLTIIIALSGTITAVKTTPKLQVGHGYWVVAAVEPRAESELTADLFRTQSDSSFNLTTIPFAGSHLVSLGTDCILQKVRECPRTTTLLVERQPPEPPEKPWRFSASEQVLINRAIGSLEEAFNEDRKALEKARQWRIGRTDITKHRRAKRFETFVGNIFKTVQGLEHALHEYRYPYLKERLLTSSAFRHLKWLRQVHSRELAKFRQKRSRTLRAEQLPTETPTAEKS